jgi:hypothetical protein
MHATIPNHLKMGIVFICTCGQVTSPLPEILLLGMKKRGKVAGKNTGDVSTMMGAQISPKTLQLNLVDEVFFYFKV